MLLANFNRKEHVRHRAVSSRQHGFLVISNESNLGRGPILPRYRDVRAFVRQKSLFRSPHPTHIRAKISGCSPWSRPVMLGTGLRQGCKRDLFFRDRDETRPIRLKVCSRRDRNDRDLPSFPETDTIKIRSRDQEVETETSSLVCGEQTSRAN